MNFKDKKEELFLTKESLESYKKELNHLINVERNKVIEEIKSAREQGDLSENAEYDAARERQGIVEARILEIESIISKAKIIENTGLKSDEITIGSRVSIFNLKTKTSHDVQIVGSLDADPFQNKISNLSPLASALIGRKTGEEVEIDVAEKYSVQILGIDNNFN
ncbi:transcription elongation factor GreA [Mycoplasma sp. 1654_15]|uniref:transcription elongation factor GreA n=1 Tax=Mycoplasma sp. 1654_15 TaxID=2725994 RepID=UPI001448FD71|nr:transcription elongation factor GreA [Mycoplasma sp. 1654_15]QJB70929.1 transcription elongation factor GreA [Mycoplasma sp. 1654_15]